MKILTGKNLCILKNYRELILKKVSGPDHQRYWIVGGQGLNLAIACYFFKKVFIFFASASV